MSVVRTLAGKISESYRKAGIQAVISLSFTLVMVLGMLFMGISLFVRFSASTRQLQDSAVQRTLSQVNLGLDSYLRSMMRLSDTVYYRIIKNTDLAEERPSSSLGLLYEENRDSVAAIAVFEEGGQLVTATPLSTLKPSSDPAGQTWFVSALLQLENLHFSTPHVQNLFESAEYSYQWVVSLSRHVELTYGGDTRRGVLLVDISFSGIEQVCRNTRLPGGGYVYIVDRNGELIYHPNQQLIYAGLAQENNLTAAELADGTHTEQFQGQSRQVTIKTVGYTGWKLVGVIPGSSLMADTNQLLLFGVSLLLFSVFLMTFITFRLSRHISQPIQELEQEVKALESGKEDLVLTKTGSYEVQRLGHSIRSMVSTMRHLMEDIIRQEESKRRSELDVLQSQINPHFLYNTLDSVIWLTENERYDDAIRMVTALGRLFRIALSRGSNLITLADELEHANHYLTIQKIRYQNKFTATVTAEPGTMELYTVKLIIQPLLENAIYHGMAAADGDGEITVRVWRREGEVCIDVTDNGLGMTQEQVAALLDESRPVKGTKGSGIGVRNVHRRVQLTFGEEYGLEFFSEPDEGTTARIHLPLVEVEQARRLGREGEP